MSRAITAQVPKGGVGGETYDHVGDEEFHLGVPHKGKRLHIHGGTAHRHTGVVGLAYGAQRGRLRQPVPVLQSPEGAERPVLVLFVEYRIGHQQHFIQRHLDTPSFFKL
jgi:hypothetical protein